MSKVILVTLKTDGGPGSVTLACTDMKPDPIFSEKVMLGGIQAFSFPFNGKYLGVEQWSVNKDAVLHWMIGPIRNTFDLKPEMLFGKAEDVPHISESTPNAPLVSHPEIIDGLVEDHGSAAPEKTREEIPAEKRRPNVAEAEAPESKSEPDPEPEPEPKPEVAKPPPSSPQANFSGWVVRSQ